MCESSKELPFLIPLLVVKVCLLTFLLEKHNIFFLVFFFLYVFVLFFESVIFFSFSFPLVSPFVHLALVF